MTTITTDASTTVSVRGSAQHEVPPDFATISFSVEATAANAETALARAGRIADACRAALTSAAGVTSSGLGRVRVRELTHWDKEREVSVSEGHAATVSGTADVTAEEVGVVVTVLVAAGARIGWLGWDLDVDNAAYRKVRQEAVADAHRAASDFAEAVGASLGALVTLADPGLLGAGVPSEHGDLSIRASASYSIEPVEELDLDPEPQTVSAHVEACFRLT